MNLLIIGNGTEELAWAQAIARYAGQGHRLLAAYPGFAEFPNTTRPIDLDEALALADVEAAVVGGGLDGRGESLRRVAAAGLPAICLHPPGDDSEAYYQVTLSRSETGTIVIPDLPIRLHPAIESLKRAIEGTELGDFRGLRVEWSAQPAVQYVARHVFARLVDVVRALIGELEAVTALGDPAGPRPGDGLIVHLRGPEARSAEVRIENVTGALNRLVVTGSTGSLAFECSSTLEGPSRLTRQTTTAGGSHEELGSWDPHAAVLAILIEALGGSDHAVHPNLLDGTRAMELAEAAVRSQKRGRTVDLHYEQISEAVSFKGVMTSLGCVVLLSILVVLPIALIGPALGFPGTIYLAYSIPPVLIVFILLQLLRFVVRNPRSEE